MFFIVFFTFNMAAINFLWSIFSFSNGNDWKVEWQFLISMCLLGVTHRLDFPDSLDASRMLSSESLDYI